MNNFIQILPWMALIALAALYLTAKKQIRKNQTQIQNLDNESEHWQHSFYKEMDESHEVQRELENAKNTISRMDSELSESKEKSKNLNWLLENIKEENSGLKESLNAKTEELANLQQMLIQTEGEQRAKDVRFDFVSVDELNIYYKGEIKTNTLVINSSLLIGDNKLFDVFKRLLISNLLPESIIRSLDFQVSDLSFIIYTQKFDENGDLERCYTWREIIEQIRAKKSLITEYLNTVIQESNRAMIVNEALLAEKPKSGKVVQHG